ncbi:DELLA protein RGL2-like [Olea europaea var. sylvestris]|uniref:DELLA protein RGL2-like n=1 Tax=Olea europaea var. sylvestris TaxID=158386 RepID=UPI000C1D0AAC|nr:DELLA protein RGL2-like [Olea europaea var. sylvestris]
MAETLFSSFHFSDTQDDCDPLIGSGKEAVVTKSQQDPLFDMEDCEFMDLFSSIYGSCQDGSCQENTMEEEFELFRNQQPDNCKQNDHMIMPFEVQSQVFELGKSLKDKVLSFSSASVELQPHYERGLKKTSEETFNNLRSENNVVGQKLTMEEILRVAGERFIQFSINNEDGISMFIHPYDSSLSGLSIEEARDVELVYLLLVAAENVGYQHFDFASKMITRCLPMAFDSGTPIQCIAYYFAIAIRERMHRETRRIMTEKTKQLVNPVKSLALEMNVTFLASHKELPFTQVVQFAGIQSIIENVKTDSKIHLIDLQIRSGIQWTALMQGLSKRHEHLIKHLKITAVGTTDQHYIEETGQRLLSFARSLNFPFSFKAVCLTDMRNFKEDLLNVEADETVVVYSFLMLRSMVSRPDCIENVMGAIRRLRPVLMVVIEVEANHNSPSFMDRFIEALLFYSAYFDCLEDCSERSSQYRMNLEGIYFNQGILNTVATEGQERTTRNVKIDVWRAFFERFRMIEIELSESSWYQANLVLNHFVYGSSCTLEHNGKGMVVGWKGTPIHSLTSWKFA